MSVSDVLRLVVQVVGGRKRLKRVTEMFAIVLPFAGPRGRGMSAQHELRLAFENSFAGLFVYIVSHTRFRRSSSSVRRGIFKLK